MTFPIRTMQVISLLDIMKQLTPTVKQALGAELEERYSLALDVTYNLLDLFVVIEVCKILSNGIMLAEDKQCLLAIIDNLEKLDVMADMYVDISPAELEWETED